MPRIPAHGERTPAHGGEEQWLEKQQDAANRLAREDDFWRSVFGSASEVAVAATTKAKDKERNAKGTRRVARRGAKRRGTKRRGTKRRGKKRGTKRRGTKRRGAKRRGPKRR